jgi:hypothetical protein
MRYHKMSAKKDHSNTALVLTLGYRGRPTNEQYFPAGNYEPGTPMHKLGDYLVDVGRAHWSGEAPTNIAPPQDRDLAGRAITLDLPQSAPVNDPVVPIYDQPAMRVSHENTLYPWQVQAAVLIAGAPNDQALDNLAAVIQKVRVNAAPAESDEDDGDIEDDEDESLEATYSGSELLKMAKDLGIDAKSNWSKTKLAEAIEAKKAENEGG